MNINLKFKEIIELRGLKQSYICEKANMTPDSVSRILKNTRKISAEEFLKLCDVLEIDPNVFRQTA